MNVVSPLQKSLIHAALEDPRTGRLKELFGDSSSLFLVGGSVRDALLGKKSEDLDFTTSSSPDEIIAILEAAGVRVIPTGLKHQTVTALPVETLPSVEITTFHGSGMSPTGGLKSGESINEDQAYRDFSINAIALCVSSGEIIDSQDGISDLQSGVIRVVGSSDERFKEDPLRIWRMIRLAAQLEFVIENKTWVAAKKHLSELESVSIERVRDEFSKLLLSKKAGWGIMQLQRIGILRDIFPELEAFVDFEQNRYHKADLFIHTLEVVDGISPDLVLRLSALFHDVGKPGTLSVDDEGERHFYRHEIVGARMTKEILERLKYPLQTTKEICILVKTHMRPLSAGAGGLRRLLRDTDELYPKWRQLKESDSLACKLEEAKLKEELLDFDQRIDEIQAAPSVSPLKNLAIKGSDLLDSGLDAGPLIGEILRALHELVLDDPSLNDKQTLLELAKKLAKELG